MPEAEKKKGRPKGSPNKATAELKDMIRQALDQSGGVEYLKTQAIENPNAFLSLVGKILPKDVNNTVTGADGEPIKHSVTLHFV